MDTADIVVLNHSLLFILLGGRDPLSDEGPGHLYPNDFLVIDEAHTIEGVAAKHLGLRLSQYELRVLLQRRCHRFFNAQSRGIHRRVCAFPRSKRRRRQLYHRRAQSPAPTLPRVSGAARAAG